MPRITCTLSTTQRFLVHCYFFVVVVVVHVHQRYSRNMFHVVQHVSTHILVKHTHHATHKTRFSRTTRCAFHVSNTQQSTVSVDSGTPVEHAHHAPIGVVHITNFRRLSQVSNHHEHTTLMKDFITIWFNGCQPIRSRPTISPIVSESMPLFRIGLRLSLVHVFHLFMGVFLFCVEVSVVDMFPRVIMFIRVSMIICRCGMLFVSV